MRGISRALGAIGEDGNGASPFDAGTFDPASFLSGALPKLFGLFSLTDLLEVAGLDEAPAFVSDALDAITTLAHARRNGSGRRSTTPQARLSDEVAKAAHGGAQAVAQHAKDQLDARAAALAGHLDALVTAVAGSARRPGRRSAPLPSALAGDLQPLLDVIGLAGVPAAVRSPAGEAGPHPDHPARPGPGRGGLGPAARGCGRRTGDRATAAGSR